MQKLQLEFDVPPESVCLPGQVRAIIAAWDGYRRAAGAYSRKVRELCAHESEDRRLGEGNAFLAVIYPHDVEIDMEKIAERARTALVRFAEERFSPAAARLSISLPCDDELPAARLDRLDLVQLWNFLERTYGGEGGKRHAYSAAASRLGSDLGLFPDDEPRMVGGRFVVDTPVYPEPILRRSTSYEDRQRLSRILSGFKAVAEWAGIWGEAEQADLANCRHMIEGTDRSAELIGRSQIGTAVLIVPFKRCWTFRLAADFAEQVNLFLTEFDGFRKRFR